MKCQAKWQDTNNEEKVCGKKITKTFPVATIQLNNGETYSKNRPRWRKDGIRYELNLCQIHVNMFYRTIESIHELVQFI